MRPMSIALLCATHLVFFPISGAADPVPDQPLLPGNQVVEPTYTPVATPRGARPHKPFEVGEIDTVDTASGNLTIRIPLGQTFTVGPKLSYRFQVVHNSSAWDFVKADWTDNGVPGDRVLPLANPGSNAGLGWELHFGKLFAPVNQRPDGMPVYDVPRWPNRDGDPTDAADRWMYVAPDGGRHYLVDLPGRDNGTFSNPIRYTKSGTFLRMRKIDASTVLVELPDGLVSEFRQTGASAAGTDFCGGGVSGCWRLQETRDLYGNRVSFSYDLTGTVETWTITDSTGRSHELELSVANADTGGGDGAPASSTQEGDEPGDIRRVLKEVRLAAFGDTVATYIFDTDVETLTRPCPNEWETAPSLYTLTVPILKTIQPPEDIPPWTITTQTDFQEGAVCLNASARVEEVQLSTLGKIAYEYGTWPMPTRCTYQNSPTAEPEYTVDGVTRRTTLDRSNTVEGIWSYRSDLTPEITASTEISGPGCRRAEYRTTTVEAPAGENGKHRKSVYWNAVHQGPQHPLGTTDYDAWQVTDAGLPYSKHSSVNGTDGRKLFLSQQIHECEGESCTLQRSIYRRYTLEYRQCSQVGGDSAGCYQVNAQAVAERTVFHDDGGRRIETHSAENTGSGRFREMSVLSNFSGSSRTERTTTTDYTTTGDTTLSIDATTGYLDPGTPSSYLPTPNDPWLLTPYAKVETIGDSRAYVTETQFDEAGSAVCLRKWKGDERGAQDVVVELELGTESGVDLGLPVTEIVSGGEYGQAGTANLCDGDESTADGRRYVYEHAYSDLVLKSTRFQGFSHYEYRADIDENTGLETSVYDVSDLRTGLTFDRLGRLRHVSPEPALQGDFIEYVYTHPSAGDAKVDVFHRTDAAVELKKETQIFDGFGRLISESRRKPVGDASFSPSIRRTAYDALGRKTKVSTWQSSAGFDIEESWRSGDYDVFDRPRTVTAPNGWIEQRAYQGIRRDTSTVQIRTSETGTSAVTSSTVRDALGRVISESNPEHTTTHAYDPYDALVSSTRTGPGLAPAGQTRSYGLDARGYLLSEDLPEVDGIVTYKPDALGLPRRTFDGLNTLDHVFDGAGRLVEVKDLSGKRWKQLLYASSNDGTNRRKGKLEHVLRVNEQADGEDLGIVETYEYRAALGKASRLTTKVYYPDRPRGSQFGAAFQQDFAYDRFGSVRSYSYPKCVTNGDGNTPCDDGNDRLAPSHTVTTTFNQGIPRTVTSSLGPTATSSYHSNFQPSEMIYGNGVTGTFAEGPAHLARPKRIEYSGPAGTLWDSGDFTFDGVGNIATIGNDFFTYDRASRLLSGTVQSAGPSRREELSYDAADNVTSFARDGGASVAHNVDASTNRLLGRRGDASILWDAAGSVTSIGQQSDGRPVFLMTNGPFRRQTSFEITDPDPGMPSRKWSYLYGPGDVRLMVEDHNGERRWTFRDPSDRIVREYVEVDDAWKHERDFIHGPSGLIATRRHNGMVRYFHADHLGTPRLYTATDGKVFSRHDYYPFGAEIENGSEVLLDGFEDGDTRFWLEAKDERRVEWTGHERDPHGLTDYMLARTCLYPFYRFGSVDPGRDGWNLFSYARNNPVAYVDPDGRFTATAAQEVLGMMGQFKNSSMSALSDGSPLGVLLATGAGTGIDLASGFVEPFTLGASTGEALGSGAGDGGVALAILGDALRFVGLAAPVVGGLRAAGTRVIVSRETMRLLPEVGRTGQLTQEGLNHIVLRHFASSSAKNAGKFSAGTTVRGLRSLVNETLQNGVFRKNTAGRPGHLFEHDFGREIGINRSGNPATRLRVVRMPDGTIKTAFPF